MGHRSLLVGAAIIAVILAADATSAYAAPPPDALSSVPVCPGPASPASAHCHSHVVTTVRRFATTGPTGLTPTDIRNAYGWSSIGNGAGSTIAIVDAYDDPQALVDLDSFSIQFNLPRPCAAVNNAPGCFIFTKVNQNGGTSYPRGDSGWALEISLDVQWAHAVAPSASILLVEAATNSFTDLLAGEDYASAHAAYVSNSWGANEFLGENTYDTHFAASGVSYFVSSGDNGTPAQYPSASRNVISVGGTTLNGSGTTWSETGWTSSGGGCSAYETANAAQSSFSQYAQANCGGKRATPDVALDANPNSGVSVLDTSGYNGQTGWFVVGGTSASSPMWAARSAVAGVVVNAAYVYGASITFRDILAGSTGTTASGCNSAGCLAGYDLTTGRGSWTSAGGPTPTPTPAPTPTPIPTPTPTPTPTPAPQTMSISSIGYSTYGGQSGTKHLQVTVTVVSGSSPVSGASVSITIANATTAQSWNNSGTTGSNGTVTFTLTNAPSGTYTSTVASCTASGHVWDGITPTNSFTK